MHFAYFLQTDSNIFVNKFKVLNSVFPVLLGLGTVFRSEKIPRNRLGTVSVIPRKKVLIPRHSEFRGRADSEARNGTEFREKSKLYGTCTAQSTYIHRVPQSSRQNWDSPNPSPASGCAPPPKPKGGGHTRLRVRGWGSPNSDDWRKSLALCLL
jgi:hypothetical protein